MLARNEIVYFMQLKIQDNLYTATLYKCSAFDKMAMAPSGTCFPDLFIIKMKSQVNLKGIKLVSITIIFLWSMAQLGGIWPFSATIHFRSIPYQILCV